MHRKTLGRLRTFDVSNSDRFVLLEEVVASPSTVGASSFFLPEVLPFQSLPRGISSVFYLWNQPAMIFPEEDAKQDDDNTP